MAAGISSSIFADAKNEVQKCRNSFINLGGPIIVCFINGRVLYYFGPPFIIAPLIFIRRLYFILF